MPICGDDEVRGVCVPCIAQGIVDADPENMGRMAPPPGTGVCIHRRDERLFVRAGQGHRR